MRTSPALFVVLLAFKLSLAYAAQSETNSASEGYTFLYFGSIIGGSHYHLLTMSGKGLVRRGHQVVSLLSSSNHDTWQRDADFSYVVFNSSYTKQNRTFSMDRTSKAVATGKLNSFFGPFLTGIHKNLTGKDGLQYMWLRECDDLLGDSATMKRLREERFDMLVGDDTMPCTPLLAQALGIPFIHSSVMYVIPSKHGYWTGLPTDPSYIPERALGLTDKMSFVQRVQNVLAHVFYGYVHHRLGLCNFDDYDDLKAKYNIKPEISTYESYKQARLYMFLGSFGLEFPRAMQPNTVYIPYSVGPSTNQTVEDGVASFLDTAPAGVVLFSMGTWIVSMERFQVQLFADSFASLPHRVLWQTTVDLTGIKLGSNTKVAKWLPLSRIMAHVNVKAYVCQGGALAIYEALWAGLPIVGLPLYEDQMDVMVRVEDRGVGISLDIRSLTPPLLSKAITTVITEPKFRKNAQRLSRILRDLQTSSLPVDTAAHWILHVTKFGGDHLRPAVQDMNFLQSSLLDVYLFISVVLGLSIAIVVSFCCFCCNCQCGKGRSSHTKED